MQASLFLPAKRWEDVGPLVARARHFGEHKAGDLLERGEYRLALVCLALSGRINLEAFQTLADFEVTAKEELPQVVMYHLGKAENLTVTLLTGEILKVFPKGGEYLVERTRKGAMVHFPKTLQAEEILETLCHYGVAAAHCHQRATK